MCQACFWSRLRCRAAVGRVCQPACEKKVPAGTVFILFLDINQSFGQINPECVGPSGIGHAAMTAPEFSSASADAGARPKISRISASSLFFTRACSKSTQASTVTTGVVVSESPHEITTRGRTPFVLLADHLDKSGTIRVFQENPLCAMDERSRLPS